MAQRATADFAFGPFRLDRRQRLLLRSDEPVPLPPKAAELLLVLTEEPGVLRTKEELLERVWPDVVVDESNLSQTIFVLRKALGDEGGRWIATVPRRGYRFVPDRPAAAPAKPPSRRLTYAVLAAVAIVVVAVAVLALVLVRSRSAARGAPLRSVAVLPFHALDPQHDDAVLDLGIADSVINKLSQLPSLAVTPTAGIARFAGRGGNVLAAGRELGVDAVLEGNIQREPSRLRCSVRLLRVADGTAIWADRYDEQAADVFSVEDAIAQHVADSLGVHLDGAARRALARRYTDNAEAYRLYLQGRYAWSSLTPKGTVSSLSFYQQALRKDPRYALAWGGMALSYMIIGIYGPMESEEAFGRARDAALHAIELDPTLAIPHEALGGVKLFHDWDWSGAHAELERAVALDPNSTAHGLLAFTLQAEGHPDAALGELRRSLASDPLWAENQHEWIKGLFFARRYDEAIADGSPLIESNPSDVEMRLMVGRAKAAIGDLAGAESQMAAALRIAPDAPFAYAGAGIVAARNGDRAEALRQLAAMERFRGRNGRIDYYAAWVYASLGDRDRTFAALDAAFRAHYPLLWRARMDPELDPLRADPRYTQFLTRMRLPPR